MRIFVIIVKSHCRCPVRIEKKSLKNTPKHTFVIDVQILQWFDRQASRWSISEKGYLAPREYYEIPVFADSVYIGP